MKKQVMMTVVNVLAVVLDLIAQFFIELKRRFKENPARALIGIIVLIVGFLPMAFTPYYVMVILYWTAPCMAYSLYLICY